MTRILFSDFDNTMMNYYGDKNVFDEYRIGVLRKLQDKGVKFCIVTGRAVSFFYQFSELLEVIDYIIGSNGACIYDVKNKKFIYQDVIEWDVLEKLIDYCISRNHSFLLNCMDKRYRFGEWDSVSVDKYIAGNRYDCEQMIVSFSKIYRDEIANSIEYFKKIKVNNATDWGDEYSIDINSINVSKGNAVYWLCNQLSIDKKDTIGFGDGSNDLSMFNVVDKGIAVANASDNIKNMADEIIFSCEEDGIYKYIENNLLK